MEVEVSSSSPDLERKGAEKASLCVKRKTLQAVLEQCQRALELLSHTEDGIVDDDDDGPEPRHEDPSSAERGDHEADELCELLKSRVECPDFLEKLECAQVSVPQDVAEEGSSWDMVSENDLWEGKSINSDQEDYVLVRQEDIVEGIACFMAAYLLSLKQAKINASVEVSPSLKMWQIDKWSMQDLRPNQLQEALSKTFSFKKNKGKLRKAWDGSKVIYNVASWGATAIGIYQNPVILRVASKAFWTSCHVISKLL